MTSEHKSRPLVGTASPEMPKEVAIASALIPYSRDDSRARYLGYLACGFSIREALRMTGVSKQWLSWRRNEPDFVELEDNIPQIRKQLAHEYVELEFYRNFRLALEKDYRVLWKALNLEKTKVELSDGSIVWVETSLSKEDQDYLLKIRSQYSTQQLQILEAIVGGSSGDGFNFAQWVAQNPDIVQVSRTDTVTMQRSIGEDAS